MTEAIKDMIEYCVDRGDLEFELNGVMWGICSSAAGRASTWYFCGQDNQPIDAWGEFSSVVEIFNAKVFNGKSLIELFDVADFSMN